MPSGKSTALVAGPLHHYVLLMESVQPNLIHAPEPIRPKETIKSQTSAEEIVFNVLPWADIVETPICVEQRETPDLHRMTISDNLALVAPSWTNDNAAPLHSLASQALHDDPHLLSAVQADEGSLVYLKDLNERY